MYAEDFSFDEVLEAYESWRETGRKAMRALHTIWQALGDYDDRKHMTFGDDPQVVVDEFLESRRVEPKVECPGYICASSFVGDNRAEELVNHYLSWHHD